MRDYVFIYILGKNMTYFGSLFQEFLAVGQTDSNGRSGDKRYFSF